MEAEAYQQVVVNAVPIFRGIMKMKEKDMDSLTHYSPVLLFYTLENIRKPKRFLMFSGGIEKQFGCNGLRNNFNPAYYLAKMRSFSDYDTDNNFLKLQIKKIKSQELSQNVNYVIMQYCLRIILEGK